MPRACVQVPVFDWLSWSSTGDRVKLMDESLHDRALSGKSLAPPMDRF